jgi:hypothetical protein
MDSMKKSPRREDPNAPKFRLNVNYVLFYCNLFSYFLKIYIYISSSIYIIYIKYAEKIFTLDTLLCYVNYKTLVNHRQHNYLSYFITRDILLNVHKQGY